LAEYKQQRLLVVDDEPDILTMLAGFLRDCGYLVLTAGNAEEALGKLAKQPDCLLLDIQMPGQDGLQLCRQIRDYFAGPIIFLTARIEETDKLQGFAAGADDYIVKPFSLRELKARVQAHLRREARHAAGERTQINFYGDLTVDFGQRCLFCQGREINLTKKEFEIVELLTQNPGQVFDKERIYERIWGWDSEGESSVVAEHIRRIRAKIAAAATSGNNRQYIETVWGVGYKWAK